MRPSTTDEEPRRWPPHRIICVMYCKSITRYGLSGPSWSINLVDYKWLEIISDPVAFARCSRNVLTGNRRSTNGGIYGRAPMRWFNVLTSLFFLLLLQVGSIGFCKRKLPRGIECVCVGAHFTTIFTLLSSKRFVLLARLTLSLLSAGLYACLFLLPPPRA